MSRTFEELAAGELDALYQGALFLSGDDSNSAEQLLVDAMTLAFNEHTVGLEPTAVPRRLEIQLVRSFLDDGPGGQVPIPHSSTEPIVHDSDDLEALDPHDLFAAAGALPAFPRAAIWLVSLLRWSHEDAAAAMNVDAKAMEGLLRYRDALHEEMSASWPGRRSKAASS